MTNTVGQKVTVVCPVYNEEGYIRNVLDFFIDASPDNKELIIVDGGSTDRTVQIIGEYMQRHSSIRLLANPKRFVPYSLNLAIENSAGDPVIRLDAHTEYSPDYFTSILRTFAKTGADIVGGPMRAAGKSDFQKAVAYATSTPLGVGDSGFHDETREGYTDSVYLGSWRRSVFAKAGLFDPDMLRNQDDEFHYRAKSVGCTIYLDPSIRSKYYPRDSFRLLFRQYFQYGLFKPLVLKKVSSGLKLRHLIPSAFFIYLVSLPVAGWFIWWLIPLVLYLCLILIFMLKSPLPEKARLMLFSVYPALHISYGSGFVKGLITVLMGRKPVI